MEESEESQRRSPSKGTSEDLITSKFKSRSVSLTRKKEDSSKKSLISDQEDSITFKEKKENSAEIFSEPDCQGEKVSFRGGTGKIPREMPENISRENQK